MLCSDADRLTSLFGGMGGGVLLGNMGVVEPLCERGIDPFVYAAELGLLVGVRLLLLLRRRNALAISRPPRCWSSSGLKLRSNLSMPAL